MTNNNGNYIGTFILDFQTIDFESDSKVAIKLII